MKHSYVKHLCLAFFRGVVFLHKLVLGWNASLNLNIGCAVRSQFVHTKELHYVGVGLLSMQQLSEVNLSVLTSL